MSYREAWRKAHQPAVGCCDDAVSYAVMMADAALDERRVCRGLPLGSATALAANDAEIVTVFEAAIAGLSCSGASQENGFDVDICRNLLYVSSVVLVAE